MMPSAFLLALHLVSATPELVVYTYDSMMAKGSFGEFVVPKFEAACKCRVQIWASGDAGQVLTRIELDFKTKNSSADIVLGLDQNAWDRMKNFTEPWGSWRPKGFKTLSQVVAGEPGFLPIDYGYFGFMADTQALEKRKISLPKRLNDLLRAEWSRNILLEDPRSSAPGLAFLLFTQSVFGAEVWNFWTKLRSQWLNLSSGWSAAYGLFLKEEARLVWSYTTSEAYHRFHGDKNRYHSVILEDGAPLQIEGASILRGSSKIVLAKDFLNFLVQPEIQEKIPHTQWMYPSRSDAKLPTEFLNLKRPQRAIKIRASETETKEVLKTWAKIISSAK